MHHCHLTVSLGFQGVHPFFDKFDLTDLVLIDPLTDYWSLKITATDHQHLPHRSDALYIVNVYCFMVCIIAQAF